MVSLIPVSVRPASTFSFILYRAGHSFTLNVFRINDAKANHWNQCRVMLQINESLSGDTFHVSRLSRLLSPVSNLSLPFLYHCTPLFPLFISLSLKHRTSGVVGHRGDAVNNFMTRLKKIMHTKNTWVWRCYLTIADIRMPDIKNYMFIYICLIFINTGLTICHRPHENFCWSLVLK